VAASTVRGFLGQVPAGTHEASALDQSDLLSIPGIDSSTIAATVDTSDAAFEAAFSEI